MMHWLIEEKAGRAIAEARRQSNTVSADAVRAFDALVTAADGDPRNVVRAGSSMDICIEGTLTQKPDIWAAWFGGGNTTYESIIRALAVAQTDPTVKDVTLRINSPGGTIDGLFECLAAIESFRYDSGKKIRAVASKAQSAAYAIAALTGNITATGPASTFGSIGTAIDFIFSTEEQIVSITNTDSPAKRPDPQTEEGRAEIVKFLDAVNDLFVDAIARGRGIDKSAVIDGYGRGASFVAADAKSRGMIDVLPKQSSRSGTSASSADSQPQVQAADAGEERKMDPEKLKAQHPDVYAAVLAVGVTQERERVVAHLIMGDAAGDMKTATDAIKAGEVMTPVLQATYMAAGMARSDRTKRQQETDAAAPTVEGAAAPTTHAPDLGDQVVALLRSGKESV